MEIIDKWTCKTYRGAALKLGVTIWRIRYAVECGYVPAPSVVLKRRALFSPEQMQAMTRYFEMEAMARNQVKHETEWIATHCSEATDCNASQ